MFLCYVILSCYCKRKFMIRWFRLWKLLSFKICKPLGLLGYLYWQKEKKNPAYRRIYAEKKNIFPVFILFPKVRSPQNDPVSFSLLSPLSESLYPIIVGLPSHSPSHFPSLLFSYTLSFYFHWTAARWDNILMALLTEKKQTKTKNPTAEFH